MFWLAIIWQLFALVSPLANFGDELAKTASFKLCSFDKIGL